MKQRVVITGMSAITALGRDPETLWDNLMRSKSGVSKIESFDVSEFPTRIAAEIKDWNPDEFIDRKESRRMDRYVQFAVSASLSALADAKLSVREDTDPERVGVYIGSGIGGLGTFEEQY